MCEPLQRRSQYLPVFVFRCPPRSLPAHALDVVGSGVVRAWSRAPPTWRAPWDSAGRDERGRLCLGVQDGGTLTVRW